MKTHHLLCRTALSGAGVLLGLTIASPAFAQASAPSSSPEVQAEGAGTEIVVTGSRLSRPDLEQSSPIAVVSGEEFQLQGTTNIENVLNDLPQVVGSSTGSSNNPGGGVATVDLRGLGAQRTLVLVDGRRYIAYDTSQIVDLNTIPAALIERVDVVTGGRSAVYGSDAISGVVNFVLKKNFSGVEARTAYEISERGDGARFNANLTVGGNFDDGKGNATVSLDYYNRNPILAGQRSFSAFALQDSRNGTAFNGGSGSVSQGRINAAGIGNIDFGPDGSFTPYVAATDAYNYAPVNYLQVPQQRFLMSAQAHYEVSEAFAPYVEAQFINNRVDNQLAATPISNSTPIGTGAAATGLGTIRLQTNSPFFSAATQAAFRALDATQTANGGVVGDGYINVSNYGFRTVGIGPRVNKDDRNAYRMLGGVRGDIGGGFSYDGYYMYARTKNSQQQTGNVSLSAFLNSVTTAFQNPTTGVVSAFPIAGLAGGGTLVCANGAATGCVPSNLFGNGNLSAASAAYLSIGATNLEEYTTQVASFSLTNSSLFDLGAGGVGIAIGAEYRSEQGSVSPDTNLASGNVAGFNPGAPTAGGYNVTEGFAEVNVPLLADRPFFNRLELNGAARYSHYSNATGNVFSWSAGGLYKPVSDLAFRGQYQQAIRGPNVNELFLGQTVSFDGVNDPCATAAAVSNAGVRAQCLATGVPQARLGDATLASSDLVNPPTFLGGNPALREEKAKTWTVGGVITPSFIRGLSVTVDYYNINIEGLISRLGQNNLFDACYSYSLNQYCTFQRDSTGEVTTIRDVTQNSGGLKTDGIDVSAGYSMPLAFVSDAAKISFSFAGTRVLKYNSTPILGVPIVNKCVGLFGNTCGQPLPKWKHSLRTTVGTGGANVSVQWRYFGAARDDDPETTFFLERAKAQNYIDLTVGGDVTDQIGFNVGVSNLFDKKPPLSASSQQNGNGEQSNTYPSAYDVFGRYFFMSLRTRF